MIGAGGWVEAPHPSKELLLAVFLPGLLFEAAYHVDAKQFAPARPAPALERLAFRRAGLGAGRELVEQLIGPRTAAGDAYARR